MILYLRKYELIYLIHNFDFYVITKLRLFLYMKKLYHVLANVIFFKLLYVYTMKICTE